MTTADFRKGQADGINGAVTVLTNVINGTDNGQNKLANLELEKVRRVMLLWRDTLIENMNKNKVIHEALSNTKKIMDIKVSN